MKFTLDTKQDYDQQGRSREQSQYACVLKALILASRTSAYIRQRRLAKGQMLSPTTCSFLMLSDHSTSDDDVAAICMLRSIVCRVMSRIERGERDDRGG